MLEAPVETDDGAGGVTRSYETVTTLWAQVEPLGARADVAAGSSAPRCATASSFARAPTSPRVTDFATARASIASSPLRESADRRFLEIDAEERED